MEPKTAVKTEESLIAACLLSFSSGLLDAYSYLFRGRVFATALTGNTVLLGVSIAAGDWMMCLKYLLIFAAFIIGVFTAQSILLKTPEDRIFAYHQRILLWEVILLIPVAFIPSGPWDILLNGVLAFVSAMQLQAFQRVRGLNFASTLCTSNLKSGTEALCKAIWKRDRSELRSMVSFYRVNAFFLLGAILGTLLFRLVSQYLILLAPAILLGCLLHLRLKR